MCVCVRVCTLTVGLMNKKLVLVVVVVTVVEMLVVSA
jgi:hypothetical protein